MTSIHRLDALQSGAKILPALLLSALLALGCGDYGGAVPGAGGGSSSSATGGEDPPGGTPGPGTGDPAASIAAFETTVYPVLQNLSCDNCHATGANGAAPLITHPDVGAAHSAVVDNQKVNFAMPEQSRLIRKVVDGHNCPNNCMSDAMEIQVAVMAWIAALPANNGGGTTVEEGILSETLTLAQGTEDLGEERYAGNLIAMWDFKEGSGEFANDVSGVEPAIELELEGPTWMSSYGIAIEDGRAIASAQDSQKLYEHIADPDTGSQQYSVEAWVIAENVTQEGPARIVSYSNGTNNRNFTVGQELYNYDFRNRTINGEISNNGTPSLQTYDDDQDLQATLQHVVVTYDQFRGRRIYVNGRWTDDVDELEPDRLWNWNPAYRLVLGNETSNNRQWLGRIQLLAIYDAVLTDAQIQQNFNAGVGKRLVLRFDISQWVGPGSFLEFTVSELDDYSYLFCTPAVITPNPNSFRVANLRVGVNGQIPVSGQAFVNVDQLITASRQELSNNCSIIPKSGGPLSDIFAIEFEVLGGFENIIVAGPPPPLPPDVFGEALPIEGIRDFARVNDTLAELTGVDATVGPVQATFAELQRQLPGGADLRAFSSSNQVGIAKLALEYCDQLVETPALRDAFFGGSVGFGQPVLQAIPDVADPTILPGRAAMIRALVRGAVGENLANQPTEADMTPALDEMFDALTVGCNAATCPAERTDTVAKAACAAVLGSAAVSIH